LALHVPQRLAFALYRSEFERLSEQASEQWYAEKLDSTSIGPYQVDSLGKQPGGGVFIRVRTSLFGLLNLTSYGFALCPTPDGTPFGAAQYATYPIGNNWYVFQANNDYF